MQKYIIRRHFVLWCHVCPLESQADAQGRVLTAIMLSCQGPLWCGSHTLQNAISY